MALSTLALFCLLGAVVGQVLAYGIGLALGIDVVEVVSALGPDSPANEVGFVRLFLGINHFFMFLLPGLAVAWVFYKINALEHLQLAKFPKWPMVGLGILFLLISMPAVQYSYLLNQKIPLPEWARMMEDSTAETVKSLLAMNTPWEFLANIVVIALLPAIGEELVFRGVLQGQLMRLNKNPHAAIWLTGILFSAVHFQFEGFLPRMLLGVALGYLYFWTKNLWVPIIAHFFNNGAQVAAMYFFADKMNIEDLEKDVQVPVYVAIGSVVLVVLLGKKISRT